MFTHNVPQVISALEKKKDIPKKMVRKTVEFAVEYLHEGITSRTPVHTGQSLRNWQWTKGAPFSGHLGEKGAGDPGRTSTMALGSEPRRAENQADSTASKEALDFSNPFDVFYLTNNHDTIMDLEYGKLPTPARSRNPAGMVRITAKELRVLLRGM